MKKLICLLLAILCCLTMSGCATAAVLTMKAISKNIEEAMPSVPEISLPQDSSSESLPGTENFLEENFGSAIGSVIDNYLDENVGENFEEDLRSQLEEQYGENYEEEVRKEFEKYLGENYSPEFEAELKEYLKGYYSKAAPSAEASALESSASENAATTLPAALPTVEELVTTDFETRLTGEDIVGNAYDCTYRVPAITIQSEDAFEINTELSAWLMPYIEEQQKYHEEGLSMVVYSIDYEAWIYNEALTLVVTVQTDWSQTFYRVFSLDIYSGESLDNKDLLRRTNLTEAALYEALYAAVEAMFDPAYAEMAGEEFFLKQRERSLSEENLDEAELYFDASGNAKAHILIYSLAGADSYEHLLDLPTL